MSSLSCVGLVVNFKKQAVALKVRCRKCNSSGKRSQPETALIAPSKSIFTKPDFLCTNPSCVCFVPGMPACIIKLCHFDKRHARGQVSAWQSATLSLISCKSVRTVSSWVDEPVRHPFSGGAQRTIYPFPRCSMLALLPVPILPQAENKINNN